MKCSHEILPTTDKIIIFYTEVIFNDTTETILYMCKERKDIKEKNNYSKGKGHGNSIYVILCPHVLEEQDINLHLHNEIVHTKINSLSHRVVCRGYYRIYSMIK